MGKGSTFVKDSAKPLITPMRRFFFKLELMKPLSRNPKRIHELDASSAALDTISEDNVLCSPSSSPLAPSPQTQVISSPPAPITSEEGPTARIAIQHEDDGFDAVVITTLPNYPFCCHEDLLTMSRQQLITVAKLFNSRVPAISRIQIGEGVPNGSIRSCIEILLGIRPATPGAPKAIKSCHSLSIAMDEDDKEADTVPSPPSSPLAMRGKRKYGRQQVTMMTKSPRILLERLDEEDEDEESHDAHARRPVKKRKISGEGQFAMRVVHPNGTTTAQAASNGSHVAGDSESPTSQRVLRSHGLKSIHGASKRDAALEHHDLLRSPGMKKHQISGVISLLTNPGDVDKDNKMDI